jgi:ABC-type methionine transport system ATPase subunit
VNKPRVLICDEPTGNLDPVTAMDIMMLLEQINVRGTTILMVTHAKDIVDKMNKRVVAIDHGQIVRDEEGSYGYEQQNVEEDIYVPGFTTFLDPRELRAAQEEISRKNARRTGRTSSSPAPASDPLDYDDSLVDTYLNGGEDVYE